MARFSPRLAFQHRYPPLECQGEVLSQQASVDETTWYGNETACRGSLVVQRGGSA
jgi:hypothetical protein